jgi:hypothetical protein
MFSKANVDGKCHRKDTAGSLKEAQARVKRRGKSSPLAEQFARHEKPHAVQDKTEGGQPVRLILGYRRITITVAAVYDRRSRFSGGSRKRVEINDHPREQSR